MIWHKWGEKICEACWCSQKAELCPLYIQSSWQRYEWEIYLFLECKGFSELWEPSQFFLFLNTHNAVLNIDVQIICISCWWWVLCFQNNLNFTELLFVWSITICYFTTFPDVQRFSADRKRFSAGKRYQGNFDLSSLSDVGRLGREHPQGWFGETFCLQMNRDGRSTSKEAKQEQSCSSSGITLTFPEELQETLCPRRVCSYPPSCPPHLQPPQSFPVEVSACKRGGVGCGAGNWMHRFCFNNELQTVTPANPLAAFFIQYHHGKN